MFFPFDELERVTEVAKEISMLRTTFRQEEGYFSFATYLFIISNNRSNFNDEVHQEAMATQRSRPVENRWIGQRIDEPALDLAGYARSQGLQAEGPIERVGDLVGALKKGLAVVAAGEPYLIDVVVQPGYSSPMVTRASGEASTGTAS